MRKRVVSTDDGSGAGIGAAVLRIVAPQAARKRTDRTGKTDRRADG
jgi:hypothetical protein